MPRPTPIDLVFGQVVEDSFPTIRSALQAADRDPTDRDAFLMLADVVTLLRRLRPEEGLGEGMDQLVALVHHAYLTWDAGTVTLEIGGEQAEELLQPAASAAEAAEVPRAYYAQFPERRIWAEVLVGEPPEPLDGCFVHATAGGELRVLGVFGLRAERVGFSVVEATGTRPEQLARADGSPLFSSILPGGEAAGLHSIMGGEELLELGWRTRVPASEAPLQAARWTP
jgi:nucleotide-binding universal stress UspA family protein